MHYEFHNSYKNKNVGLFARHMVMRGYDVEFLVSTIRTAPGFDGGVRVIEFPARSTFSWRLLAYMARHGRDFEFLWCYPTSTVFHALLLLICRARGIKVLVKLDSLWSTRSGWRKFLSDCLRLPLRLAHRVLYESRELGSRLPSWLSDRMFYYPVMYSPQLQGRCDNIRQVIDAKEQLIIYSGRINRQKNLGGLVSAFLELNVPGWKLLIIGQVEEADYYQQEVAPHLGDSISYRGYLEGEEYFDVLKRARLLVIPSISEGQPNVMIEAMYWGLGIVVSRNTNIRDFDEFDLMKTFDPSVRDDLRAQLQALVDIYDPEPAVANHERVTQSFLLESRLDEALADKT
ncbi:MAG: glycosyltransferase family 4 protein [Pseudomonadales bacterium]|nr:glycosyltransferase family 4 protein [Pseudomonadales bacterium]